MATDAKTLQKRVGLRVSELRRARGLTQEAVAHALRMEPRSYAKIEQGARNLRLDTILRVAAALGVDVAELFVRPRITKVSVGRPKETT